MKVRLKGDRTPFHVGESFVIPISEKETAIIAVYEVIKETGAGLARSADGKKYRCYGYGWSNETLDQLPETGMARLYLRSDVDRIFYPDHGFEYWDGTRQPA